MHEAFWNGLFDVRWEEAPLGPEAIASGSSAPCAVSSSTAC